MSYLSLQHSRDFKDVYDSIKKIRFSDFTEIENSLEQAFGRFFIFFLTLVIVFRTLQHFLVVLIMPFLHTLEKMLEHMI